MEKRKLQGNFNIVMEFKWHAMYGPFGIYCSEAVSLSCSRILINVTPNDI